MAEEALKTEETEELELPAGGIADFVMEDDELEEAYGDESEDFGDTGIAQFPELAERMAKYGRNEDNMLAHVAEGELVIPKQFLEDEVMKQRIFDVLTEAGVEDPDAYVVGSEANDLNPTTGLPEFFLKKLFKGIGKAIKKVVKTVVKVVKKVAPVILPIALAFTPLGPIYGAALGSGIGTLISGGSIKDALKSALISGAIGGVTAGFTGNTGSFTGNVGEAASGFGARLSQTASGFRSTLTGGGFTGEGNLFSQYRPTVKESVTQTIKQGDTLSQIAQQNNTTVEALMQANQITDPNMIIAGESLTIPPASPGGAKPPVTRSVVDTQASVSTTPVTGEIGKPPGFFESVKGALDPTDDITFGQGMKDAFLPQRTTATDVLQARNIDPLAATTAQQTAAAQIAKNVSPGLLRSYGPLAAAGTVAAGGLGFFDVPETEQASFLEYNEDGSPVTGRDLIDADPGKYLVRDLGQMRLNVETGKYEPVGQDPTTEEESDAALAPLPLQPVMNSGGPFARPFVTERYAAEGGPIFPRRTGGIAPTEGVPGEDSVRAMLMPGEFVMTTDAVRGLGNGNLNNGIKNMYTVMRNLESRGEAMA